MFDALQYVKQHSTGKHITVADVETLLQSVQGTTFASIVQCTPVTLAAKHKAAGISISKVTRANVQLFNNLAEFTNAYENAVKRSAAKLGQDASKVEAFESSGNYFEHTDCYSIVKHKTQEQFYLFVIYNNAESVYVEGDTVVDKQHVAQYLTPGAAKELLTPKQVVENKTHELSHTVQVRAVKLENIVEIVAQKQHVSM